MLGQYDGISIGTKKSFLAKSTVTKSEFYLEKWHLPLEKQIHHLVYIVPHIHQLKLF